MVERTANPVSWQGLESQDKTAGDASEVYTLGSDASERDRLRRQTDELHEHAVALLDRVGVRPGWRALDLACGPRGTLELLAERVGGDGQVLGLDINPVHVTQARQLVSQRGLRNVRVTVGDARATGLPSASFDLVHARLLLVNIPDPEAVVAEIVRLLRPGGTVACEEADGALMLCHPPDTAYDRLNATFREMYARLGADLGIGRRLHQLLDDAGVVDIGIEARADVRPAGHPRRTVMLDLVRAMRSKVIAAGLLTAHEHEQLDRRARAHLAAPGTIVVPYLSFLAWGRVPEAIP
jgi:SAM-dependent methyltransferase